VPPSANGGTLGRLGAALTKTMHADTGADAALVIDLDADLLQGNLAGEVFWARMRHDWRRALTGHGAAAGTDLLDIAQLPYDARVLARCRAARMTGTRTVLVSAAPPAFVEAIASELGCFDAAEGGLAQAHSHRGGSARWTMADLFRAMRPHQWVKNLLVFLPLLAAQRFELATLGWSVLAFLSFGLIASAVYLVNDLIDLPADRRHPAKRHRPFASGRLPLRIGTRAAPALLGAGLLLGALAGVELLVVMLCYAVVTTAYSIRLKGSLAADIVVLAVLYTLRIIAGGAATGIDLSMWLLGFSIFLFLSLGAVKRLAELVDMEQAGGRQQAAGRAYETEDRPVVAMIATASGFVAVLVFALHISSPEVSAMFGAPQLLWGICLVLLFWISRTVLLAHRGLVDQDPIVFALTDRASLVSGLATAALFVAAILG